MLKNIRNIKNIIRFRSNSVFLRFYLEIFAVVMALFLLFSAYIYTIHVSNFSNTLRMNSTAYLRQTVEKTDSILEVLSENILALSKERAIIASALMYSKNNAESVANTAKELKTATDNYEYYRRIFLYTPYDGMLFSSDATIEQMDSSKYKETVKKILSADSASRQYFVKGSRASVWLEPLGSKVYLV